MLKRVPLVQYHVLVALDSAIYITGHLGRALALAILTAPFVAILLYAYGAMFAAASMFPQIAKPIASLTLADLYAGLGPLSIAVASCVWLPIEVLCIVKSGPIADVPKNLTQ